jgi:hypothetical protein
LAFQEKNDRGGLFAVFDGLVQMMVPLSLSSTIVSVGLSSRSAITHSMGCMGSLDTSDVALSTHFWREMSLRVPEP